MRRGVVVKMGGSLMDTANEVIRILATSPVPVLIVPGGGIFADGVRYLGIDGTAAHWMAVAAMDQYGWFLSTFGVSAVDECLMPTVGVKIFLPYRFLRDVDPLPHSWDVTSDTISAWIAGQLECPLLLLKSVDGVLLEDELLAEVPEGMIPDVIDPCCLDILRKFAVSAKIINGRCLTRISDYLRGFDVLGTQLP